MDFVTEYKKSDGTIVSNRSRQVSITVWPELYEALTALAAKEERSLSGQIRWLLKEAVLPEIKYDVT